MPGCGVLQNFLFLANLFAHISFYLLVAISVDRFLAVHLHLRYQELVTYKRVVSVVVFISLLSVFVSSMTFWVPQHIRHLYLVIDEFICICTTTVAYVRVYLAVHRHKNQIQGQGVQLGALSGEMLTGTIKTVVSVFYVHVMFLVCYLPLFIFLASTKIIGSGIILKKIYLFSLSFIFLNSSLNPLIYGWKMRHIRHAVVDILRSMSCKRTHNRGDHHLPPANWAQVSE